MKKIIYLIFALLMPISTAMAQRHTDRLDRGLVAVPSDGGNFVSWKIFGEEYYNTTYNLYANGTLLKGELKVGCFNHSGGNASTKYQVAAVVNGVEQEKCAAVKRWENGYMDIPVDTVMDRDGQIVTSEYILNDISLGDVTGNGISEFIVKRNYTGDILNSSNKTRFHHYECYTINGERLWWIDLGPNLMSGPDEQWDLIAYDWDEDGKAECVMRGADNMIIHTATGLDIQIGDMSYYAPRDEYTHQGAEYLLYLNGETGEPFDLETKSTFNRPLTARLGAKASGNSQPSIVNYTPMAYPLPRFEQGESDYSVVWGSNDTGHRSAKHYLGAPVLDGKHASIFLGRGCYTRHKMCALDVNPVTHELTQRWRWNCYDSSPWFGNGFHNFSIGDVDWDGRDEIIFGSMIIDDNGKGLCTTGLGHGDAQHCTDLDPYRHGSEQFTCNETSPACTYFNASTGKFYYRLQSGSDDGRALAGNFSNSFPGSIGRTTQTGVVSLTADKVITNGAPSTEDRNDALFWSHLNQRIYWDGDLCDEVMDSPGSEARDAAIYKPAGGRLLTTSGCSTNNSSKNNPCAIADIFGDWREELVMRTSDNTNIRIYTTTVPTTYRIYTLWHDHQYRNAIVWQCVGYNQPPHKSYFLGEMEGITVAPPPYTNSDRSLISSSITDANDGQIVLIYDTQDQTINVADGAAPAVAIFNVPTWVQGTNSNIVNGVAKVETVTYTCTVTGGAFGATTRIVKQGDGILNLPAVEQPTTAPTDIWAGTLNFSGKLLYSSLWLNRFAELNSDGGEFRRIKADYAAIIRPGGADNCGIIKTDSLMLGFGSRTMFDIYADGTASDKITTRVLSIETKLTGNWLTYGPKYLAPVIEVINHGEEIADGSYLLFDGVETLKGKLTDIIIEGIGTSKKYSLSQDGEKIYLVVGAVRDASDIIWTGATSSEWQFGGEENFRLTSDTDGTPVNFITGDVVRFTDEATKVTVNLKGEIEADSVIVDATKNYTFKGIGAIIAGTTLVKRGTGTLTIQTDNSYIGGTRISGGKLSVTSIANENQASGNLGGVTTAPNKFVIENGAILSTSGAVTQGSPMQIAGTYGGIIDNAGDFIVNKAISGTTLVKRGSGWMKMNTPSSLQRLVIEGGTVQCYNANKVASTVEFAGGKYNENTGSKFTLHVPAGKTGFWTTANRSNYSNKVTGEGTLTIYCEEEKGNGWFATRTQLCLDFSSFKGTIKATGRSDDSGARWTLNTSSGLPKGTLEIADGLEVQNTGKTFAIGRLAGTGKLGGWASFSNNGVSGTNTWQVGNDSDWTWGGIVTANSNLTKVGTGKVTFNGASDHTGITVVSSGELHFGVKATLGTGSLTVKKGATLSGTTATNASLTNSVYDINAGATLQVGASVTSSSGNINFGGKNVTIAKDAILSIGVGHAATSSNRGCTSLSGINCLTMDGTIQLHYADTAADNLAPGDSIVLWTATTVIGTPVLESEIISEERDLYWDTTDIMHGILRVTNQKPVGIGVIKNDKVKMNNEDDAVYDLNGRKVADKLIPNLRKGIYLFKVKKIIIN